MVTPIRSAGDGRTLLLLGLLVELPPPIVRGKVRLEP